jgi:nucleoside-diphosphate-sugar epimerase
MILVTGSRGFVGAGLVSSLLARGHRVRGAVRSIEPSGPSGSHTHPVVVSDLSAFTDWSAALTGADCVIHCAARTHVMNETEADALAAYRSVNVQGTRRLAEQAALAGVRRLVFLSSVKVNGATTDGLPRPFGVRDDEESYDEIAPEDPYGISKWEAELSLREISAKTGLEVVIVRPPLVYGPGVKGNLARLLKLVRNRVPLPLGGVQNKRSLIGLDNLVELLILCADHPAAAGKTFLVSDGEDLSTPELLRHMAVSIGRPALLFPVPVSLLRLAGSALGKRAEIDRLVGSLQIDSSHTRRVLGWAPPMSAREGIRKMVQGA